MRLSPGRHLVQQLFADRRHLVLRTSGSEVSNCNTGCRGQPQVLIVNGMDACIQGGEDKPVSDQWLPPFVIVDDDDKPVGPIEEGDSVRPHWPGC